MWTAALLQLRWEMCLIFKPTTAYPNLVSHTGAETIRNRIGMNSDELVYDPERSNLFNKLCFLIYELMFGLISKYALHSHSSTNFNGSYSKAQANTVETGIHLKTKNVWWSVSACNTVLKKISNKIYLQLYQTFVIVTCQIQVPPLKQVKYIMHCFLHICWTKGYRHILK